MANSGSTTEQAKRLGEELDALERQAGIHDQAERAREAPVFWFNPFDLTHQQRAEEQDTHATRIRRKIRDAYFSIADLDLRKRLISTDRKLHEVWLRSCDDDIGEAAQSVAKARAAADRQPWEMAALIAGVCVAVGYVGAGLPGAIGGAVVGFFLGQGTIANAKSKARQHLESAEDLLKEAKADNEELAKRPEYFTVGEELTGERDGSFDPWTASPR